MQKNFYMNNPLTRQSAQKFNIDVEKLLYLPGNICTYWKEVGSIFIGCNDMMAETAKIPSREACAGLTDYIYCRPEEADSLCQNDTHVITNQISQTFSETITVGNNRVEFTSLKLPLKNQDGKIIGIFGLSCILSQYNLKKALPTLETANVPIKHFLQKNISNTKLSTQQLECLYWLAKGMTIKQIAETMTLSPRTVESYFETIKTKLHCSSRSELIQHALKITEIKSRL